MVQNVNPDDKVVIPDSVTNSDLSSLLPNEFQSKVDIRNSQPTTDVTAVKWESVDLSPEDLADIEKLTLPKIDFGR